MEHFEKAALFVLSKECMNEYFYKYNFFHEACFKATLSTLLGYSIIAGSLTVKVPQITKILNAKSGEGINIISIMMEMFAITATGGYSYANNFPFSSWGETLFVGIQTVVIAFLVMFYTDGLTKASSFLASYSAVVAAIVLNLVPMKILWTAQSMNIPVLLFGRFIQIFTNYSNGHTGQLSAITSFMLFFGALARIFTSIQETGDMAIIWMFAASTFAHSLICFQLMYYWNKTAAQEAAYRKMK